MSDRIVTVFAVIGALVGSSLLWLILRNMQREIDAAMRRNMAIDRVRELHSPAPNGPVTCNGCQAYWPCPTIRALDGDNGE